MKEVKMTTVIKECRVEELDEERRRLVERARQTSRGAYAPYSHFHVGAAIQMADGSVVAGSNQENAAYPSGMCAERTAAYYASALHPGVAMKKIAVAAWTREGHSVDASDDECFQKHPISPCGACRQALLEYEHLHGDIEVILYGRDICYIFPSISSLLPYSFTDF